MIRTIQLGAVFNLFRGVLIKALYSLRFCARSQMVALPLHVCVSNVPLSSMSTAKKHIDRDCSGTHALSVS